MCLSAQPCWIKMSEAPLFSVVIPVYNKEPHIARTLSSVLAQTYRDFDLLVVCDPSTDSSTAEVEKFTDPRIRIFHRSERGPGGSLARNLGIQRARTKWVAFLDADDEWLPDHLMRLNDLIQEFPDQKILSAGWEIRGDGDKRIDPYSLKKVGRLPHIVNRKEYLQAETRFERPICSDVACVQKDLLVDIGGFPDQAKLGRGGDVDTWFRCVMQAGSLAYSNHIGAIYHLDATNRGSMINPANFISSYRDNILYWLDKTEGDKISSLLYARDYMMVISGWVGNLLIRSAPHKIFVPKIGKVFPKNLVIRGILFCILSLLPKRFAVAVYNMRKDLGPKLKRLLRRPPHHPAPSDPETSSPRKTAKPV